MGVHQSQPAESIIVHKGLFLALTSILHLAESWLAQYLRAFYCRDTTTAFFLVCLSFMPVNQLYTARLFTAGLLGWDFLQAQKDVSHFLLDLESHWQQTSAALSR